MKINKALIGLAMMAALTAATPVMTPHEAYVDKLRKRESKSKNRKKAERRKGRG